jgi:hypothetical protein
MQEVRDPQRAALLQRPAEDERTQDVRGDERVALPSAYQPGKWTRAKREEDAKLASQELAVCQNLFKRKPRKMNLLESVAGDGSVNRIRVDLI